MQKVHRLGRRSLAWLALPVALASSAATFLLIPQNPTTLALVATRDLPEGSEVSQSDFTQVALSLGESASLYPAKVTEEAILTSRLAKGQLLTLTNLTATDFDTRIPVVLQFKEPLPQGLRPGSLVDVWATYVLGLETSEPSAIALECQVEHLAEATSLGQKQVTLELSCSPEFIPKLLKAQAAGAKLAIIFKPTSIER